ncbi:nickel ABC transporter permease subunit NikC [Helicobacter bilis]|uniref:nickel ABC transporter permease subunit NikC n=1 Tax=Helicobacter bilis TaxID=37372 RepID=UPI0026F18A59|nr:nickel ABC transporter permease subunit NikC [Helicobacter bilis]MCI7411367.1 nickel ABC transporter permease subunit NikC [Helicobacter bilis]MDD7296997.1 nickel ABC transporter permease subunit NikC [Helicobacter bilis]MDY4400881.1 nickel ABC transporter permease subunit NikC [Helicobacter bilis]
MTTDSKLYRKKLSFMGKFALVMIIFLLLIALIAPFFLPYAPDAIDLDNRFSPISTEHFLGTDHLGRDIFTRLIFGARISLFSVGIILVCVMFLGISIGGIAGFFGGKIDKFIMRICDLFLSLPTIVLSLFLVGILGAGLENVMLAIALTHWAWYARIIRSIVLGLKHREFVLLSQVYGASNWQIFKRNMLTPILTQCFVLATMDIGHIMLHIAGLSFLGLGVQPPQAEWGVMLSDSKDYVFSNPELLLYPGLALFIAVALFNMLGDSLRDYFDCDSNIIH